MENRPYQQQSKEEMLKTLSFRFNLCTMYELNNVCSIAKLERNTDIKYSKHNSKSYMDMKKKGIREEAKQERLRTQRDIINMLGERDVGTVELVADEVYRYLRADGYKLS